MARIDAAVRADASRPAKTSWPVRLYLSAIVFAFFTLALFTTTLSGAAINAARLRTHAGILLLFVLRLLWAVHRREQSKRWRVYVWLMFLAAPLWLLVEPWLFALWRRGG